MFNADSRFGSSIQVASSLRGRAAPSRVLLAVLAFTLLVLSGTGLPAQAQSQTSDEARAPSNLSARIVDTGVELTWDPPTQDAASVTGYEIAVSRRDRDEVIWQAPVTLVADTGTTDTTYTDTSATEPGVRYAYRVKAIRGAARSAWTAYDGATVPLASPPRNLTARLVDGVVELNWRPPAEDAESVQGLRDTAPPAQRGRAKAVDAGV